PFNPAGLAAQRDVQFGLGFASFKVLPAGAADRSDISAALAGFGPGGGWGGLWRREETSGFAKDREVRFGYGWKGGWEGRDMRLDLGAAGAYLDRVSLNTSDSKTAPAADLGALLYLGNRARIGASILNVNQPGLGIDGVPDQAPRAFKLG